MFDTHRTTVAAPYPQEITEKRAPTDDSIRIWDELREKALKSVLAAIPAGDNTFEGTFIRLNPGYDNPFDEVLLVKFRLNGAEHVYRHRIDFHITDIQALVDEVAAGLGHFLADTVLRRIIIPSNLPALRTFGR